MSDTNFSQVLQNCQSENNNVRIEATTSVQKMEQQNLPIYLVKLCLELADDTKPTGSRQMAGLLLKNSLSSKDEAKKQMLAKQWMDLKEDTKKQVRFQIFNTINSSNKETRRVSAQVLSRIATIELEKNSWGEVLDELVQNVLKPKSEFGMESSLLTLGYICEECESELLTKKSNQILSAVIYGMKSKINEIKYAAVVAFLNSLYFFGDNFKVLQERDQIMGVVCECTQSSEENIRLNAMESLVKIALLYYDYIQPYMEALFKITAAAITKDKESVVLQAIEFWSTVAEVEENILYEIEFQGADKKRFQNFIGSALKLKLGDLLTQYCLTKQDENQTEEDWNISAAGSTCISLITKVVKGQIVEAIFGFITKNIKNTDWHYKEAATLAFSAILEIEGDSMKKLVEEALPIILGHVKNETTLVKDTTVFTIGRIAQFHPDVLTKFIDPVFQCLSIAIQDESRIASKACWSLFHIASQFPHESFLTNSPIAKYLMGVIKSLLTTSERKDVSENNLRINLYAALSAFINASSPDMDQYLEQVAQALCGRLEQSLKQGTITKEEKEEIQLVQGLLCGALQSLTVKLKGKMKKFFDGLMGLYLTIITKGLSSGDEIFLAISAIVNVLGVEFERYMKAFAPVLCIGLKAFKEEQMCATCISLVVDLSTGLELKMLPYCDDIMTIFSQNLQNQNLPSSLKPLIISSFGDIALAIGGNFEKYLGFVCGILKQASEAKVTEETQDEETINYINRLRENILGAYVGILQGLKKDKPQAFNQFVDQLVNFLAKIGGEQNVDADVFKNAISVIGDLINVYGTKIKQLLGQEGFRKMVDKAKNSDDPSIQEAGRYAFDQMKKHFNA